jgi:ribosomal-protein-alanine N-acetyltransferase
MSRFKDFDKVTAEPMNLSYDSTNVRSLRMAEVVSLEVVRERNKDHISKSRKQDYNIDTNLFMIFGIFENRHLVGEIALFEFDEVTRSCYISCWVDKDFCNMGIATRALKLIHEYSFSLGLDNMLAAIKTDNTASMRVMDKSGFKQVKLLEKYYFVDGQWEDHYLYESIDDNDGYQ